VLAQAAAAEMPPKKAKHFLELLKDPEVKGSSQGSYGRCHYA
jgi:hypothetical protein